MMIRQDDYHVAGDGLILNLGIARAQPVDMIGQQGAAPILQTEHSEIHGSGQARAAIARDTVRIRWIG
jgi:hypothetical protein